MGMVSNEHEYKMMGMAPYASLKAARDTADIFHNGYRMENGSLATCQWTARGNVCIQLLAREA
jgi:predicted NodU family carbamoyl transferase